MPKTAAKGADRGPCCCCCCLRSWPYGDAVGWYAANHEGVRAEDRKTGRQGGGCEPIQLRGFLIDSVSNRIVRQTKGYGSRKILCFDF